MKWLDKWILRAYRRARNEDEVMCVDELTPRRGPKVSMHYGSEDTIGFRVYSARGGMVIECITHDTKQDRELVKLHVIPDGDDLAESLSKIITMEYLSR